MKFAFFFLAEYANMVVISSIATVLFFGGWLRPFPNVAALSFLDVVPAADPLVPRPRWPSFLFCYIWFRGTFPRYRFDQLMGLGWKVFIPVEPGQRAWRSALGVLLLGRTAMSVWGLDRFAVPLDLVQGLGVTGQYPLQQEGDDPVPGGAAGAGGPLPRHVRLLRGALHRAATPAPRRARSTSSTSRTTSRSSRSTARRRRRRSSTATTSTSSGACSAASARRPARPSRCRSG